MFRIQPAQPLCRCGCWRSAIRFGASGPRGLPRWRIVRIGFYGRLLAAELAAPGWRIPLQRVLLSHKRNDSLRQGWRSYPTDAAEVCFRKFILRQPATGSGFLFMKHGIHTRPSLVQCAQRGYFFCWGCRHVVTTVDDDLLPLGRCAECHSPRVHWNPPALPPEREVYRDIYAD